MVKVMMIWRILILASLLILELPILPRPPPLEDRGSPTLRGAWSGETCLCPALTPDPVRAAPPLLLPRAESVYITVTVMIEATELSALPLNVVAAGRTPSSLTTELLGIPNCRDQRSPHDDLWLAHGCPVSQSCFPS
jgi:hypothetical protein